MRADGFTYIELLLAIALTAVLVAAAHDALGRAWRRHAQLSDPSVAELQSALAIVAGDLRCAALPGSDVGGAFVLRTESGFPRLAFHRADRRPGKPDFLPVTVAVEQDGSGRFSLLREFGGRRSFLCGNLTEVRLEAFDGDRWQRQWGWDESQGAPSRGVRGLPLMISIHLAVGEGDARREGRRIVPVFTSLLGRAVHG